MAFFKFRNRGSQGNEGRSASVASPPAESVEAMRRRARHRLLGAAVLVLVGVIGFPLLFDTQPRPVSVDIPIEIPDRNKVKPLTVPTTPAPTSAAPDGDGGKGIASTRIAAASPSSAMITETADGSEISASKPVTTAPVPKPDSKPDSKPEVKAEAKPELKPEPKPEHKPEVKPKPEVKAEAKPKPEPKSEAKAEPKPKPTEVKAASSEDGARARALLEGKVASSATATTATASATSTAKQPAASDEAGRFAVQVGAFADASKAREVRQKLESAGLKTYTHVAKTADGERTRVRVGPFATRAEADRAASRVKSLSLAASVLTL
ncbi:DedD protein [Variovorax sp. GrIS 2.14]|uniref:SPOR domain-containing protein n=1 Tax=Variovorax sp. GrIS 2.14 TaxID=3071709 RepID=UPI0038F5F17B